ncbi:uncharacterized protein LOC129312541 [Prosopis cineraria]|uniref:uncharacterized protein LOC129312541 n=1 Tax=Prosopis cineraria TaxID=364024 RepID=UPI00240F72CA|nr:uncharacterized protein LOC129312541 [Prosopis cineraria]
MRQSQLPSTFCLPWHSFLCNPNSLPIPSAPSTAYTHLLPPFSHLAQRGGGDAFMRFLSEFTSCCGCAPPRSPVPKRTSFVPRPTKTPRPPPSCRPRRVLKRRRLPAPAQWKPTLVPISEDDDEVATRRCDSTRLGKQGKRRTNASEALHYDYESRRAGASKVITAFYPMPYMF